MALRPGGSHGRHSRFDFFVFAVVFVIFDVELVLVLPVVMRKFHSISLRCFFILIVNLLSLGLFLEWNNSAFE